MKNNFTQCTLKDIASNEKGSIISGPFGSNISSKFFQESGVPVIRGNNLSNSCIKFIDNGFAYLTEEKADELNAYAIKDDLLFTAAGTIGQVGIIEENTKFEKYVISNKQLRVRLNIEKINPLYAYYWFSSPWMVKDIVNKNTGSTVPLINLGIIKTLEIKIPKERVIQDKIVSVLSALDSKIELNNRINTELEAMAKMLYDYWFVQFDFPDKDDKPYKTSGGKMVWNEELKREIPDGWEVDKIGNIFRTSLGGTPSTRVKEYWENGTINWLNSGEIANFPIIDSELKITEVAIRNSATDLLPKGSVLLSITRHLRPTILAIDACANQSVVGIKEKNDYKCYFLYPYLKNEIPRLNTMRSGAQQPHINKEIVDESFIVIPNESSNIMKAYNSKVGHLYEFIINNALQNQTLSELRDWLLPMLMNGQVQVTPSH